MSNTQTAVGNLVQPDIGDYWPGQGGIYAGLARGEGGAPDHHLVLSAAMPETMLDWDDAIVWAKAVREDGHADFELPTRRQSALLYANLQDHFYAGDYWTGMEFSGSHAWSQSFYEGRQAIHNKQFLVRCVAVRAVILPAASAALASVQKDQA